MLRALSVCGAGGAASMSGLLSCARGPEDQYFGVDRSKLDSEKRFLIVIAATGGASIVDSFLATRASECTNAATLNTFADNQVVDISGSPFRAAKVSNMNLGAIPIPVTTDQSAFVNKHKSEMLVATCTGTSVNHVIAQKRSITGNGAWKGRTLQEAVALQYGADVPIPNVNMAVSGYLERGSDDELPSYCYAENVSSPALWPLGLHGSKGIKGAPDASLIELARKMRNEKLDAESVFARTFEKSPRLKRWYEQRGPGQEKLEAADLISRLNILPNSAQVPLAEYGLSNSPDTAKLTALFPNFFTDPFEGQAALAYLLLKNRVSVTATIGPSFNVVLTNQLGNPPLAFDFSHNAHRATQGFMWNKILSIADRLSDLLKAEPLDPANPTGPSMWSKTLIYVATDFGRTRTRIANQADFGSGHDLNNGFLMLSPLVKGNTLLGGVNRQTTYTYGFDPETGVADPMKQTSNERDLYAGMLHALGVDTTGSGLPDAKAFRV